MKSCSIALGSWHSVAFWGNPVPVIRPRGCDNSEKRKQRHHRRKRMRPLALNSGHDVDRILHDFPFPQLTVFLPVRQESPECYTKRLGYYSDQSKSIPYTSASLHSILCFLQSFFWHSAEQYLTSKHRIHFLSAPPFFDSVAPQFRHLSFP